RSCPHSLEWQSNELSTGMLRGCEPDELHARGCLEFVLHSGGIHLVPGAHSGCVPKGPRHDFRWADPVILSTARSYS
ncbi:hypothetical protein ACIP23_37435, partial [Streptomyces sp. NPDC089733]|uniref:hypothetical protein n=1 Tax=Streptomyces sp. NPDC089733 TaxID=3365918 RepID=UPI0037FDA649